MRESERRSHIPAWAARERLADMAWIGEKLDEFRRAAQLGSAEFGRGAIVVDTAIQLPPGEDFSLWYALQVVIDEYGGDDDVRMVERSPLANPKWWSKRGERDWLQCQIEDAIGHGRCRKWVRWVGRHHLFPAA